VADFVANQTFKHFRDAVVSRRSDKKPPFIRALIKRNKDHGDCAGAARYYDSESLMGIYNSISEGKTISEIPEFNTESYV
jgi:hypothetical protein